MKKFLFLIGALILSIALAACGGANSAGTSPNNSGGENAAVDTNSSQDARTNNSNSDGTQTTKGSGSRLSDDFDGALTVPAQLALGTIQLEKTDLAVNEDQAADLLPLWQAFQTLRQSDTTADIELQAVVNSIEDAMNSDQLAAIADMKLTDETMSTLMESGELGFRPGGRGTGENSGNGNSRGGFGGGFPGGGPGGFPGGGPPDGGGFPGGGLGDFGGGNLSEDDLATRRAEFSANGTGTFQDRILTGVVTRLLEDKLGIISEGAQRGQVMNDAFTAVASAAGLSVEDLQSQLAEGQTMAEIVQSSGGDLDALQTQLIEIFKGLPNAGDLDLENSVGTWLGIQ